MLGKVTASSKKGQGTQDGRENVPMASRYWRAWKGNTRSRWLEKDLEDRRGGTVVVRLPGRWGRTCRESACGAGWCLGEVDLGGVIGIAFHP